MSISPSRRLRWGLALALCLSGCAETAVTYTPLNGPRPEIKARQPDQLQVFSSAPPERPHMDIGLISVQEGDGDETPASLIEILRRTGAERGCDALVLAPPGTTTRPTGLSYANRSYQVYSATCIVYRSAQPGDVGATFEPSAPSSTSVVYPQEPPRGTADRRRICQSRRDFDENRNCILDMRR